MEIHLYKNVSDMKQLNKSITLIRSVNAVLLDDNISILHPRLILETTASSIINCNYAYIPNWNRYYYINDYSVDTAGRIKVDMNVDVLMSFKNEINLLDVIAERSSNKYNLFLADNAIPMLNKPFVITKRMSYGLFTPNNLSDDSDCYCLVVLSPEGV